MAFFRTQKKQYISHRLMSDLLSKELADYLHKSNFENTGNFNIIKSRLMHKLDANTVKPRTKAKAMSALNDFERLLATLRD